MAIQLKNLLLDAEDGSFTINLPDGTTSTQQFRQRSFTYRDNANTDPPLIVKDFDGNPLPGVEDSTTNPALELVGEVTDNFVRGGAVTLAQRAVTDLERFSKVIVSPKGLAWTATQLALARTNPVGPIPEKDPNAPSDAEGGLLNRISGTLNNALTNIIGPRNQVTLPINTGLTIGTGAAGIRFRKDGVLDADIETGHSYDPNRGGDKYDKITTQNAKVDINENALNVVDTKNRLFNLYGRHILELPSGMDSVTNDSNFLLEYGGGAHSIFGIGKTQIKKYRSNPYNDIALNGGYIPFFNKNLFELRQGRNPSIRHQDYRSKGGSIEGITKVGKPIPNEKTRINLYNVGNPGTKVTEDESNYEVFNVTTIDKVSAAGIFKRENFNNEVSNELFKDYIDFRIAVVNNNNPQKDNVILFRAFLDSLSDNYNGQWNSYKYNGRAEEFYTYGGFSRAIDFSFKIHAQSRFEQKPLWRKLNYLVAQTAPEYKNNRMRGIFSRLTIGSWMDEIPGFFTSVGLSWSKSYPWEIRHDGGEDGKDENINQYPHILDVSCQFQPVHNFAPNNSPTTPFILPELSVEGNRRYDQKSDNEGIESFRNNGIADSAAFADIDIGQIPGEFTNRQPAPTNADLLQNRGLIT
jgi:hypothetical protein